MNPLFHYENIIFIIVILFPNLILLVFKPTHTPIRSRKTMMWRIIGWIEHVGRFITMFFCLLSPVSLDGTFKYVILVLMVLVIGLYYIGWLRYITAGHDYCVLFEPLLKIPFPMVLLPTLFFLLVSWLIQSAEMGVSTLIFAVAHLFDSNRIRQSCQFIRQKKDV